MLGFAGGAAWDVPQSHGGIVILPHGSPAVVEHLLVTFLAAFADIRDKLFEWRPVTGWRVTTYRP
jgi:hypothetical protein